ncbi:FtsW/RodA/SpoVE family cell cycle protein [Bacillus massiliigorillae]|uniref:FtsW/RodA/SpoVE family cell cycle protein n=1 Tax=Bacillus massiliigorillae TaxID=1243664 RepID=UPI00039B39E9|nr:FtsW/RodA/SpoVE family cell cycle protein [Bacillus massiliigorillae]
MLKKEIRNKIRSFDLVLIVTIIALSVFGLVMIYSASMIVGPAKYEVDSNYFYIKQIKNLILAAIAFTIFAIIPYKLYQRKAVLMTIVFSSIGTLLLLDVFGHTANNAQSWIKVFGMNIQPSEFIKLGVIIYLSAIYAKKQKYINNFNAGVLPPLFFLLIVCVLIFLQPDFGTMLIILLIATTIILSSGMSFKSLMKLGSILLIAAIIIVPVLFLMKDQIFTENRMGRIYSFIEPFKYEEKEGYQLVNSYIAIGSGGVSGSGLGNSIQKYGYLPEPHTDFIMAVISEELGAKGVLFVLGCLSFIILRGYRIAVKCRDPFGSLLVIGISSMIGIQSFINLGGVTGLIPITGVTLPFVSYGGSSIVILAISMGVLVNVSMFTNYENKYKLNREARNIAS